jgi:hypothetical protein
MNRDWFRNESWNKAIETDFFARLARSRSGHDQYLAIQALMLAEREPMVALSLVDVYFESKKSSFDDIRALDARSRAQLKLGQLEGSLQTMKEILAIERANPYSKTNTYTDYPYLVATRHFESEYSAALALLAERQSDLAFPVSFFKWHAAKALIHKARSESALSKQHAASALEAAQIEKSGFRFHQKLGLVGPAHKAVVAELRAICA